MKKREAFTWKESFTTHDYDILEPFKIPPSRLRIHSQTCHDFDKNKKNEISISHKLPILTTTSNHILHKFEVTPDKQKTHRERPHLTTKKMNKRGHSYNDSVDPIWTRTHMNNMKMPDSRWTRRSINISTTRPSQKRDKTKCIYLQYPRKRKLISTCKQRKIHNTFIFKRAEDSQTSPMLIGKVPKSSSRLVVQKCYPQGEE